MLGHASTWVKFSRTTISTSTASTLTCSFKQRRSSVCIKTHTCSLPLSVRYQESSSHGKVQRLLNCCRRRQNSSKLAASPKFSPDIKHLKANLGLFQASPFQTILRTQVSNTIVSANYQFTSILKNHASVTNQCLKMFSKVPDLRKHAAALAVLPFDTWWELWNSLVSCQKHEDHGGYFKAAKQHCKSRTVGDESITKLE